MENNKEKSITLKRLKDRAESVSLLVDYYEETDIVDIYGYNMIAYMLYSELISSNDPILAKEECPKELRQLLFDIARQAVLIPEDKMHVSTLTTILSIIAQYKIPNTLLNHLQDIYSLNERVIELEYRINMNSTSKKVKTELSQQIRQLTLQIKKEALVIGQLELDKLYLDSTKTTPKGTDDSEIPPKKKH